jgi:thymidylate kinase
MSKVIVFEGSDCVGKQTQSEMLVESLNKIGKTSIRIEIPYDDNFSSRIIKKFLGSNIVNKFPTLFQAIQVIQKLQQD